MAPAAAKAAKQITRSDAPVSTRRLSSGARLRTVAGDGYARLVVEFRYADRLDTRLPGRCLEIVAVPDGSTGTQTSRWTTGLRMTSWPVCRRGHRRAVRHRAHQRRHASESTWDRRSIPEGSRCPRVLPVTARLQDHCSLRAGDRRRRLEVIFDDSGTVGRTDVALPRRRSISDRHPGFRLVV